MKTYQLHNKIVNIGHPILGDKLYGTSGNILLHKGLFLQASAVQFNMAGQEKMISLELPKKYSRIIRLVSSLLQ